MHVFFRQQKIGGLRNRVPLFLPQIADAGNAVTVFNYAVGKSFFNDIHHFFRAGLRDNFAQQIRIVIVA